MLSTNLGRLLNGDGESGRERTLPPIAAPPSLPSSRVTGHSDGSPSPTVHYHLLPLPVHLRHPIQNSKEPRIRHSNPLQVPLPSQYNHNLP